MAQGKKSFIFYADWENIFNELPDADAGKLIKHICAYVNDRNPESDSILIKAVFANVKTTLKRDLDKWESQLQQRRDAGKASAEARKNKNNDSNNRSTTVQPRERNPTDNGNVIVNDNENVLLKKETKSKKEKVIKIKFDDSEIFDVYKFAAKFPKWNKIKLKHYYESAVSYSKEGHRYVDWAGAINNWARKDDLIGKLKFDESGPENKNRPAPPPATIRYE